ncbi:MAG TPA: hypothetical protein VF194_01085 [Ferrovibrio sp.]|uniref:lipopolysaccharide biosynthesis protein n=1 Tax=Ferrovibrio sp. TaxID=1917215 RepID=UPI002ED3A891
MAPEQLATPADFTHALYQDFVGYLISLGLQNAGGLLLLPVVTAYLQPADLGLFSLIETAQVQGVTFGLLGLKFAYLYYYAHVPPEQRPVLLGATLLLCGLAGAAAGGLLWAGFSSASLMSLFDSAILPHAWLLVPLLASGVLQTILLTELRAARRVWLAGVIGLSQLTLVLLLSLAAVAIYDLGLPGLLAAQALAQFFSCGLALALVAGRFRLGLPPELSWKLLRYGMPMMLGLMLRYSLDSLCRFFLAALVSIEAAGQFMIAAKVTSLFDAVLALPFFMAWGGLVHHALRQPMASAIIGRVSSIALTAGAPLVFLLLLARGPLFALLAHDAMPQLAGVYALLLLNRAVQLAKSPLTAGILQTGRTGWSVRNNLFALAIFLAACYPAAEMAGMAGIAAVLLAANFIAAASLTVAAQRLCAQRIEPAAIGLAAFAAIAGLAFVFVGPVSPPIWVLAFVIAGACLMAVFRQARVTDRI